MGSKKPQQQEHHHQWRMLDLVAVAIVLCMGAFFVCVFTPLGDSLAATGSQALAGEHALSIHGDGDQRQLLLRKAELGNTVLQVCGNAYSVDHTPCEDPRLSSHLSRERNFYRERHCPPPHESLLCLLPPPPGYRISVPWPQSLHQIWYHNMPYAKIAERKGHQGWMKQEGPYFVFPGGGTMFPDGAVQYIQKLQQYIPLSGGTIRTVLDVGCGVASFGGYLLKENILTMSFAPRDSHKSQIQFALERGIPAFLLMLGTHRLPFPAHAFDFIHCSRCLIPFAANNGSYMIEMDRLLRPGGYFVISGPPVQWPKKDEEWADLQNVAKMLCYEVINVDGYTAVWKKPSNLSCLRTDSSNKVALCDKRDDPSAAWYVKLKDCATWVPAAKDNEHALEKLPNWPSRLHQPPERPIGIRNYVDIFGADARRWKRRVSYYKKDLNLKLGSPFVRNIMDMNAGFGGFAAALIADPVWVMNVVPAQTRSTLSVIYDRGLIGVYHDWCEAFSTYPRTYDFIHVVNIQSLIHDPNGGGNRCSLVSLMVEMDRILRPEGTVVIRDAPKVIEKATRIANAVRWNAEIYKTEPESSGKEQLLVAKKRFWTLAS